MKAYRGSRGIAPLILNLSTRWRWVVNYTPLGKELRYPGDWVGPRAGVDVYGEKSLVPPGIRTPDSPALA